MLFPIMPKTLMSTVSRAGGWGGRVGGVTGRRRTWLGSGRGQSLGYMPHGKSDLFIVLLFNIYFGTYKAILKGIQMKSCAMSYTYVDRAIWLCNVIGAKH